MRSYTPCHATPSHPGECPSPLRRSCPFRFLLATVAGLCCFATAFSVDSAISRFMLHANLAFAQIDIMTERGFDYPRLSYVLSL